ncbi:glycosyltransferase [Pseudoruegeria sp. HB172150]|uniref:glycosyltransferase n=1 Tax=Pseudoruegeria sp. HB172150 TaxID=2721164 RepID=UPI0015574CBB|nr:glycosyltransferase [Pseudoruegeria sp. HB172150]
MLRIAHLVDDTNPGGVTRYLDFLASDPGMAELAHHQIVVVPRNRPARVAVEADVIVSHLAISWRGLPGLMSLRARHSGIPLIHVEHSYSAGFVTANVKARRRFHTLLRTAYALFERVVAVSHAQANWLLQRDLVQNDVLSVIQPQVDLTRLRALPRPSGPIRTIGAIGRLDRQKGFGPLIRAFRELEGKDLRLRIFGDGPERETLERLAGDDPRIRFEGFVADPCEAYGSCDAIVMPSRWEPYGLVAAEALAAGRTVMVSGVDGLMDHVATGAHYFGAPTIENLRKALMDTCKESQPTEVIHEVGPLHPGLAVQWRQLLFKTLPNLSISGRVADATS